MLIVETLYSTIYYSKYFIELNLDKSTQYVALWTHKRIRIDTWSQCIPWPVMCLKSTVLLRVSSTRVPDITLRLFGDWDIRRSMSACWDREPRSPSMPELYMNISPQKTLLAHTSYGFLVGTSLCLMDYAKWFTKYWLLISAFFR